MTRLPPQFAHAPAQVAEEGVDLELAAGAVAVPALDALAGGVIAVHPVVVHLGDVALGVIGDIELST